MKSPLPCQSCRDSEQVSVARFAEGIHQWRPLGRQGGSFVSKTDAFGYSNTHHHGGHLGVVYFDNRSRNQILFL